MPLESSISSCCDQLYQLYLLSEPMKKCFRFDRLSTEGHSQYTLGIDVAFGGKNMRKAIEAQGYPEKKSMKARLITYGLVVAALLYRHDSSAFFASVPRSFNLDCLF